ncbi:hypothetical protein DXG01_007955 [Tephrocybe rancida]|nr:hypothetical protein DXG01_007955 [Tephrocybe rancida]
MPRILPRLLAQPLSHKLDTPFTLKRRRPRSFKRPVPPPPSFKPSDHPRSILLHDPDTNPITRSRVHIRHKSLPPLPKKLKVRKYETDGPRGMTEQERRFWSSPYLRMLASPIRQCILTHRYLPNDFLLRLAIHRVPPSHTPPTWKRPDAPQVLLPSGLQSPQYSLRRSGKAHYTLLSRAALSRLSDPATKRRAAHNASPHPMLAEHVAHLLRLRVLQELELVAEAMERRQLRRRARAREPPTSRILRRLTRTEWGALRETGTAPFPGALAVLEAAPLRKDIATGRRIAPNMSAAPPSPEDVSQFKVPLHAASSLLPVCPEPPYDPHAGSGVLPPERIPVYHGPALFPYRGQRAALDALLRRISGLEGAEGYVEVPGGQEKRSYAYLLCADGESVGRVDTVGVAIALWRLRMFEDYGGAVEELGEGGTEGWDWTGRALRWMF